MVRRTESCGTSWAMLILLEIKTTIDIPNLKVYNGIIYPLLSHVILVLLFLTYLYTSAFNKHNLLCDGLKKEPVLIWLW